MIANCITISRILFSLAMILFPPSSIPFAVLYVLCGATDVLDDFAARKLHTESEKGAMLDSTADLLFAVVYALKILPILNLPIGLWIWIVIIASAKITVILIASKKVHRLSIAHSFGNKLTGLLLFFLPLSICGVDVKYTATLVCAVATGTVIKEMADQKERHTL